MLFLFCFRSYLFVSFLFLYIFFFFTFLYREHVKNKHRPGIIHIITNNKKKTSVEKCITRLLLVFFFFYKKENQYKIKETVSIEERNQKHEKLSLDLSTEFVTKHNTPILLQSTDFYIFSHKMQGVVVPYTHTLHLKSIHLLCCSCNYKLL